MAELRIEYKTIFGESPPSKKMNVAKKKVKVVCELKADSKPARRSERLEFIRKSPVFTCSLDVVKANVIVGDLKDESRYICEHCDNSFVYKNSLEKHIISIHKQKVFTCSSCGKHFNRLDSLKRHKDNVHSETDKVTYSCKLCSKSFAYKHNLVKHSVKYHVIEL